MTYNNICHDNERFIDGLEELLMGNYYAYMRISTKEERGKQGYSRQEKSLERYAKNNNIEYVFTLKEDKSGKSFIGRKEWNKLEKIVQPGDTIVFKDICRFTRECNNGKDKYISLMNRGVNLIFLDNPTISTDYIKALSNAKDNTDNVVSLTIDFIVQLILTVELDRAEKERLFISQRTKDGMKAHKEQAEAAGLEWHCGRPLGSAEKVTEELITDIKGFISDRGIKYITLMRKHNISRNTLKKYIKLYNAGELKCQ